MTTFFEAIQNRRPYESVTAEAVVSKERLLDVLEHVVTYVPTPFNVQSSKLLVLLGEQHRQFWSDASKNKEMSKNDILEQVAHHKAGFGTVLFFEDQQAIADAKKQQPKKLDYFSSWSDHSSGMLQLTAWNALQVEGFGANLYHYPLLTRLEDKEKWEVPEWWELKAQLPFGKPSGSPIEINEVESEKILRIYGKK
ncbi:MULTISPECIES: nitroreductase family protein [Shouchella]|uniref:Nitroreductase family protein n=2 Tax=Shouchella TaxID=2893057 RepID=A0ABY7W6N4_9BACI|nr:MULTISPECIES: nitroreductase family protein [Shouchella]MED4126688.1 nitroreductase family protein [Shouchella miscanthi]WDF04612.1 nitroreductase family protein [Shouchella hunanensis]